MISTRKWVSNILRDCKHVKTAVWKKGELLRTDTLDVVVKCIGGFHTPLLQKIHTHNETRFMPASFTPKSLAPCKNLINACWMNAK